MALVGWDMVCSIPTTLDVVPSGVATGPTAEPTAEPTAARAAAPSAAHLVRQLSVSVPDDNNYWHIMYSFFFSVSRVAGMHCSWVEGGKLELCNGGGMYNSKLRNLSTCLLQPNNYACVSTEYEHQIELQIAKVVAKYRIVTFPFSTFYKWGLIYLKEARKLRTIGSCKERTAARHNLD